MAKKNPTRPAKRKGAKPAKSVPQARKPVKAVKKPVAVPARPRQVVKVAGTVVKPAKSAKPTTAATRAVVPAVAPAAKPAASQRAAAGKANPPAALAVNYKVGMIVDHPNRPQWGPGKIIAVAEDRIHVVFRDQLERTAKAIIPSVVPLNVATTQSDAVLDLLPAATEADGSWNLPRKFAGLKDAEALVIKSPPPERKSTR